jgi:hypothetical protein
VGITACLCEGVYLPIQTGKSRSGLDLGLQGDDTGDNISEKNESFCEQTVFYWVWKNIKKYYPNLEYIGLSHYRRFFALPSSSFYHENILKNKIPKMKNYDKLIPKLLSNHDVIIQRPIMLGYNLEENYGKCNPIKDYYIMKDVVHDLCPEYDESFLYIFEGHEFSTCAIFISKWDFFEKYYEWLFPLLFEAEKRMDTSDYTPNQKRAIAYLAEVLLNVYVYHSKLKPYYTQIYFIDKGYTAYESVKRIVRGILPQKSAKILAWMENIVHPRNE